MRILLLAAALALGAGCSKNAEKAPSADVAQVATMTVDQVDQAIAKGDCQAVDANEPATRKHLGVVPGAVLLSDYDTFKISELPADKHKPLVFYCANTQCGASHHAAEKAITAGYTNVKVMPEGIAGWVSAGKKTQTI